MNSNLLRQRIQDDMKAAMRAKDSERLGVIRLLLAAIKQREIDERISLQDPEILTVIEKMIKQRREAYTQFKAGNRQDLADKEAFEIEVLQKYLPKPLNEAEIDAIIDKTIKATNATSMRDMGKVMKIVKQQTQGRADMDKVSAKVKAKLTV
ncbi:MAG: glutamyl-tRNA amidotransferase [Coxiella sp. DG_40]|nr:MAG: glutamyl-tRNA amidotransferase [Coxiella sp. DG_40]